MIITYTCDFCQASFKDREKEAYHEANCDQNPELKSCATCRYHDFQDGDKIREHWKPQGGPWESEDEIPTPLGCFIFNDQTWRRRCEKWKIKPRLYKAAA